MSKTSLAGILIVAAMLLPLATSAQTTDLQSQIIALLTQIITLQKSLIETLTNQITQLQNQIANLAPPVSGRLSTQHICAIVNPPACMTTLSVTYDSYNCVTAYSCKPVTTTSSSSTASCSNQWGETIAHGQRHCNVNPQSRIAACPPAMYQLCQNGQWVSATQTTGASCTYNGTTFGHGAVNTLWPSDSVIAPHCCSGEWKFVLQCS